MSSTHGYNLRPNVNTRVDKRIKDMVDANGGPDCVVGKRSATGLGVHLTFQYESPKPTLRSPRAPAKEDVEMEDETESNSGSSSDPDMDSSESSSSSGSGTDTVEPNAPASGNYETASLLLRTPRPRRTEDLQPEDCPEGTVTSTDGSVTDTLSFTASRRKVPSYRDDVEAARRRVEAQRRQEAKRIRIEQLQKQARLEAWKLRQQADDLEQETAKGVAHLLREDRSTSMDEDEDGFDVQSNHSYAPTETSEPSDGHWLSSPPLWLNAPNSQKCHIEDSERSPTPTLPATPPLGPQVEKRRHTQTGSVVSPARSGTNVVAA
jgi:hypothetical protein